MTLLFAICLIACLSIGKTDAQTDLTRAQLSEYNKQRLSLDLQGVGMGSYGSGRVSYSSWTKWKAYQGFNSISESKLYSITGYEDLAYRASKRETRGKTLLITGLCLMGGGVAVMLASEETMLIGAGVSLLGMVAGYWSIGINTSNMKPYGVAMGIADEYNQQLMMTIKRNF